MAESIRRKIKMWITEELVRNWKDSDCLVLVDIEGVSANDMTSLRSFLRSRNVGLKVAKSRLIKRALAALNKPQPPQMLRGMTGVVWGGQGVDPVAVCRTIVDWQKKEGFPKIKGALFLEEVLDATGTVRAAALPTKQEMISQIAGLFYSSLASFVNILQAQFVKLLACFQEHAQKMESQKA